MSSRNLGEFFFLFSKVLVLIFTWLFDHCGCACCAKGSNNMQPHTSFHKCFILFSYGWMVFFCGCANFCVHVYLHDHVDFCGSTGFHGCSSLHNLCGHAYYVQGRITHNNMQLLIDAFSSCQCDHSYLHGCACCVVRKNNIKSWLCFFSKEEEEQ